MDGFNNGVFQVAGPGGLFSEPGQLTHLMQHLWDRYKLHLEVLLGTRAGRGQKVPTLDATIKKAPAIHFAEWATQYLTDNRPVETFFSEGNVGLRLTNNVLVVLSPGEEQTKPGTMQQSASFSVTEGRSQPGNEGVSTTSGLRV